MRSPQEAGEGTSVVVDILGRYEKWFEQSDDGIRCTVVGLAALARETGGPTGLPWSNARRGSPTTNRLRARVLLPKRELDQVYVTTDTAVRRAELLGAVG